ncbi:MAG: DUF2849 domain-containing protein [Kiloniellales bacterium]
MTLKVITANRLREGDAVYLRADGSWSDWLEEAQVARDPAEELRLLALAEVGVADRVVVGPYAFAVAEENGTLRPLGQRETLRSKGPSVHPGFGKQAVRG